MPTNEHLVLCSGTNAQPRGDEKPLTLNLHGASANVRLEIKDISRRLLINVTDVHSDLMEIASYIYAADSAISRGDNTDRHLGAKWRRKLRFVIPVRQPRLWSSDLVTPVLVETISFLSDDDYEFEFRQLETSPPVESYFTLSGSDDAKFAPNEVSFVLRVASIHSRGPSRNWSRMARRLRLSAIVPLQRLLKRKTT
jgi:hypothetical protein